MKPMTHHPFRKASRYPAVSTLLCVLLIISLMSGCATGPQPRRYKYSGVKTITGSEAVRTNDQIDRYATLATYFKLGKAVDEISIGITAEYVADITGAKKIKKTYFIVEKIVVMSNYKIKNLKYLFAEIGRNYDADWNREKEITLASNKTVPFKALDEKSIYRIRFTTFSTENTNFVITIGADCEVTFMDTIE
jgi:hypothetical protein